MKSCLYIHLYFLQIEVHFKCPVTQEQFVCKQTHEARGVVVPHGLGVTERLQQGVGLDDLILQGSLLKEANFMFRINQKKRT